MERPNVFVTQTTQVVPVNEVLKHSQRNEKVLSSFWISGSYYFSMWDITETQGGERGRGKKTMCHTLPIPPRRQFFFSFCEALQVKLNSKNILIELGWTGEGSFS